MRNNSLSEKQDFFRALRIVIDQHGGRLQSIKQEMRLKLHAQSRKLRLSQLCFELRGMHFSKAGLIIHSIDVECRKESPIRKQTELRVVREVVPQCIRESANGQRRESTQGRLREKTPSPVSSKLAAMWMGSDRFQVRASICQRWPNHKTSGVRTPHR